MTVSRRVAGAVLVGGASSRFGRDKAWATVDGSALAVRVADALDEARASPVFVVGGTEHDAQRHELAWVADRWPGSGPLGGIVTALAHTRQVAPDTEMTAVLGCDLARPDPGAISRLIEALDARRSADLAVARHDDRRQWHLAVWRRSALETLSSLFDRGERAVWRAGEALEVVDVDGLSADSCADIDTPADLPGAGDPTPVRSPRD